MATRAHRREPLLSTPSSSLPSATRIGGGGTASQPPPPQQQSTASASLLFHLETETLAEQAQRETARAATPTTATVASPSSSSCCHEYWQECVWPGLGLFGESYLLFSVGTLQPLWNVLFPSCFVYHTTCTVPLLQAIPYATVVGVIVGMIVVGTCVAQPLGRRVGSLLTATLMVLGAMGLTGTAWQMVPNVGSDNDDAEDDSATAASAERTMVGCLIVSLFVFGLGVGGEYPLAASSASESAMGPMTAKMRQQVDQDENNNQNQQKGGGSNSPPVKNMVRAVSQQHSSLSSPTQQHRGRRIQLVFSMQGMGIFCNSIVMTCLLIIYGQTDQDNYHLPSLLNIWRWTYVFGLAVLTLVLVTRFLYLKESAVWLEDKERRIQQHRLEKIQNLLQEQQQQLQTKNSMENNHETSSVVAPGASSSPHHAMAPAPMSPTAERMPAPPIVSPPSDVSSLSAPSLAAIEFDEHHMSGGPFVSLKEEVSGNDVAEDAQLPVWMLLVKHFGVRLLGVSSCWFLWDVAFYGNKLFQSSFLLALTGQGIGGNGRSNDGNDDIDDDEMNEEIAISLVSFSLAASLNAGIALLGYFGAALLVDNPSIGRRQLQQWGFFLTGALFVSCGFFYHSLSSFALVVMYLGSSFFGQLGPNATTFVLPAEVFPTQVRTTCHGLAAAAGKAGALCAALVFPHVQSDLDLFLLSGYASLLASVITFWTIPETTGLDLFELDRKWRMILAGRRDEYVGDANHPRFLSIYERNKWSAQHHQVQANEMHYNHAMDDF